MLGSRVRIPLVQPLLRNAESLKNTLAFGFFLRDGIGPSGARFNGCGRKLRITGAKGFGIIFFYSNRTGAFWNELRVHVVWV